MSGSVPEFSERRAPWRMLIWSCCLAFAFSAMVSAAEQGGDAGGGGGGLYISPIWLGLVAVGGATWLYLVSWISMDARGVGLKAPRWITGFTAGGIFVLLLSFLIHPALIFLLLAGMGGGFCYYLWVRNPMVPVKFQILGQFIGGDEARQGLATGGEEGVELPHVEVGMTNEDGRTLAEFIDKHPDFSGSAELLGDIIAHAADERATEVRIRAGEEQFGVFYKLDGVMQKTDSLDQDTGGSIVRGLAGFLGFRGKGSAEADVTVSVPEEGEIDVTVEGLKTRPGPSLSFELPDWHTDVYRGGLEGLGMRDEMAEKLQDMVETPGSVILFTGPSGSGRTSTYHAALSHIDIFTTDVMTLESTVEHELDQVMRHEVDVGSEEEMEELLPAVFREGPDVIGVDEVTHPRLVQPLLEFARDDGRLLATIESSSASKGLVRFARWLEDDLVAQTLTGVTCQRLIRLLCEHCKEEIEPNRKVLKKLKIRPDQAGTWYRAVGCKQCLGVGYRGRTALFELLTVNDRVRKLIAAGKASSAKAVKKAAGREGLSTLYQDALLKVRQGRTTLKEVRRVLK